VDGIRTNGGVSVVYEDPDTGDRTDVTESSTVTSENPAVVSVDTIRLLLRLQRILA